MAPLSAAVIVTTPQKLAFIDVAKGVRMFSKLKVCLYITYPILFKVTCSPVTTLHYRSWDERNIFLGYQVYATEVSCHWILNTLHMLGSTGPMHCSSWEHVPLWCWWETLLPIWKRIRLSGKIILHCPCYYIMFLTLSDRLKVILTLKCYANLKTINILMEAKRNSWPIKVESETRKAYLIHLSLQVVQQFGIPHLFDLPIRPTVSSVFLFHFSLLH